MDDLGPPLHPLIAPVAGLLGTWTGTGRGAYPTIEPFEYAETVTFGQVGKPFLVYAQRTRSLVAGQPMHAESGFWRFPAPGRIEVVLSHPTGVGEIEEGTVELDLSGAIEIELASTSVSLSSTAKQVTALERSIRIEGDELEYTVRMAAVGIPLRHHLTARLVREPPD